MAKDRHEMAYIPGLNGLNMGESTISDRPYTALLNLGASCAWDTISHLKEVLSPAEIKFDTASWTSETTLVPMVDMKSENESQSAVAAHDLDLGTEYKHMGAWGNYQGEDTDDTSAFEGSALVESVSGIGSASAISPMVTMRPVVASESDIPYPDTLRNTTTGATIYSALAEAALRTEDNDSPGPRPRICRKGLPLLFQMDTETLKEVIAGYDTGTRANHMSMELAEAMGYTVDTSPTGKCQFLLPNGRVIEAIGKVTAQVRFAQTADDQGGFITCYFNVFKRLASPALMGMSFLHATETITKYTSRLVDLPRAWNRSLRMCAIGNATNQVTCVVNGREVSAHADTGSEIALVSGAYALRHGLLREYSCEELELADGTLEYTCGFGDLTLSIATPDGLDKTTRTVRFHVLKSLQFDMILDEDIVNDLNVFGEGMTSVVAATAAVVGSLAPIIHLRTLEQSLARTTEKVKNWASSMFSTATNSGQQQQQSVSDILELINELDQEENRRLNQSSSKGSPSTSLHIDLENQKQAQYQAERQRLANELRNLDRNLGNRVGTF